jgi:hypothetical protein
MEGMSMRAAVLQLVEVQQLAHHHVMPLGEEVELLLRQGLGLHLLVGDQPAHLVVLLLQGLGLVEQHQALEVAGLGGLHLHDLGQLLHLGRGQVLAAGDHVGQEAGGGDAHLLEHGPVGEQPVHPLSVLQQVPQVFPVIGVFEYLAHGSGLFPCKLYYRRLGGTTASVINRLLKVSEWKRLARFYPHG